jgi:hypothetical protein
MWKTALLSFLLCSCAVAPLSNHVTARTNGKGESLASVGSTVGVGNTGWLPSLKYSVGLLDDLDVGFQYEVIEYGVWGKYAFWNRQEGFSLAALAGAGISFEGFYLYGGPELSWKSGWFEPYFLTRFNYVNYPEAKIALASIGEFSVPPGTYRYLQHTLGFMVWPKDWFGFGLEGSAFTTIASSFVLQGKDKFLLSGNFSFRF